jgi:hypothetical protein
VILKIYRNKNYLLHYVEFEENNWYEKTIMEKLMKKEKNKIGSSSHSRKSSFSQMNSDSDWDIFFSEILVSQ